MKEIFDWMVVLFEWLGMNTDVDKDKSIVFAPGFLWVMQEGSA